MPSRSSRRLYCSARPDLGVPRPHCHPERSRVTLCSYPRSAEFAAGLGFAPVRWVLTWANFHERTTMTAKSRHHNLIILILPLLLAPSLWSQSAVPPLPADIPATADHYSLLLMGNPASRPASHLDCPRRRSPHFFPVQ